MKKICCLILTMLLLVGCGTPYSKENPTYSKELSDGYFVEINNFDSFGNGYNVEYKIVYAKDTKVKYLIALRTHGYAITPLYNADGSLQIYDEKEQK